jgi:hypothetical protein
MKRLTAANDETVVGAWQAVATLDATRDSVTLTRPRRLPALR